MFQRLREGLKGLVDKISTTELRAEQVSAVMKDFKLDLIGNDVAVLVADHIGDEMEKKLGGLQVKRLGDRKQVVNNLCDLKQNLRTTIRKKA